METTPAKNRNESELIKALFSPRSIAVIGASRTEGKLGHAVSPTSYKMGNIWPNPRIIARAEEQGVPIILTRHDTMTAIDRVEKFFGKTRLHQDKKVQRFENLLNEHMDFDRLYKSLGLQEPK